MCFFNVDNYGIHFSPGRLRSLCELEWYPLEGRWLSEGSSDLLTIMTAWNAVISSPNHHNQFPYAEHCLISIMNLLLLLKTCALSLGDRVLLVYPEHFEEQKVLQVLLALPEEVDIPPPYATIGLRGNSSKARGNDSPQRKGQEADSITFGSFSPCTERVALPMGRIADLV